MTTSQRTGAPCSESPGGPCAGAARALGRAAAAAAFATVVLATVVATGCISVDITGNKGAAIPEDRFHVLDAADLGTKAAAVAVSANSGVPGPAAASAPAQPSPRRPVIAVRTFRSRDRFGKHVVRRDDAGRITPLDHEIWADEPSQAVTDAVREALSASGTFAAAVDPSDAHEADYSLSGTLLEFAVVLPRGATERADAQEPPSPRASGVAAKALFQVRMTLAESRTGRVLATGAYSGEADLQGATAAGLGPAMSRAVGQAIRALLDDLRTARTTRSGPASRVLNDPENR